MRGSLNGAGPSACARPRAREWRDGMRTVRDVAHALACSASLVLSHVDARLSVSRASRSPGRDTNPCKVPGTSSSVTSTPDATTHHECRVGRVQAPLLEHEATREHEAKAEQRAGAGGDECEDLEAHGGLLGSVAD